MNTTLTKFYDPKQKRVVFLSTRLMSELKPKIVQLLIGKNSTKLKMAPEWFKHDEHNEALKNIVYPEGVTENRPFDTVARYRAATHHPKNDFRKSSLNANKGNTETLIIALDDFVQQYGGELSFTDEDVLFEQTAHRAACGVANLSSAHLVATDYIPTAIFTFLIDLDYQLDLARTSETMQNFTLSFSNAIAQVLNCPNDYIRVTSIEKLGKKRRGAKVNFGITTPNPTKTEELVEDLKNQARKGFRNHPILKNVKQDDYECKWIPLISFFQLKPSDFDSEFNIDYTSSMPTKDKRANLPYFLPIGWYRHALKVVDKYPDDKLWLGHDNVEGEWAVAYHGTHGGAVKGIKEEGLLITKVDLKREEAVALGGKHFDKPGLYVATHCNGGAHPQYTKTFVIEPSPEKSETFRVVFQCRVRPGAYTTHGTPVKKGEAWRFVDPEAIRPYGILVKNESTSDPIVE